MACSAFALQVSPQPAAHGGSEVFKLRRTGKHQLVLQPPARPGSKSHAGSQSVFSSASLGHSVSLFSFSLFHSYPFSLSLSLFPSLYLYVSLPLTAPVTHSQFFSISLSLSLFWPLSSCLYLIKFKSLYWHVIEKVYSEYNTRILDGTLYSGFILLSRVNLISILRPPPHV